MKNSLSIVLSLMTIYPCLCHAADKVLTYDDIASRLYDFERLATVPIKGELGGAFTSTNRFSRYDAATDKYIEWGADGDGARANNPSTRLIPREGDNIIAAEIDGPGVLWRFWSAYPEDGNVRIFIDGDEKPVIDQSFREFFEEFEKIYPNLALTLSKGRNRFIPIPFQKSCKVLLAPGWGCFYRITYSKFPQGTKIESFAGYTDQVHASLRKADTVWGQRGKNLHKSIEGVNVLRQEITVAPDKKAELKIEGPRAIQAIEIFPELPKDIAVQENVLREMTFTIKWDGESVPSVWAPLGDFFGTSPGVNHYKSLPMGMTAFNSLEDKFYCNWYMPFEKDAVIELTNDGKEARRIGITVETVPLEKPASELLRFHAWWHGDDYTGVDKKRFIKGSKGDRWPDWPLLVTEGCGRFVGITLHIWFRGKYWSEGDEKFFVDGEKYPSTFGTGSEDYVGFAWYPCFTFDSALGCLTYLLPDNKKEMSVNRFHVCDDIPFTKSFEGVIEKYNPNYDLEGGPCLYDTTVYWYAMPGSKSPYKKIPLAERRHFRP